MIKPTNSLSLRPIRWLTYLMFFMFAMTSDAVGVVIPELIRTFDLSMAQASAFHYAPMILIALSGLFLGGLADRLGRKPTILIGLLLFTSACFLFALGDSFVFFLLLLCLIGTAIGLFKTGALALIGDISANSHEHTQTMNKVEGFFGVGAILGPAIVSALLVAGVSWKYLYLLAGAMCAVLCLLAWHSRYPEQQTTADGSVDTRGVLQMLGNRYALGYSLVIALYVATEVAIYVWMPTLLQDYQGSLATLATYALTIFFILRAAGRFAAVWLLRHFRWQAVLFWLSLAILVCFLGSALQGVNTAVILLPLSGAFMSMIYPTLNSKGISCFPPTQHGAVAGVILFFTAAAAALGPFLMGLVSDTFGHISYGFYLATAFALLLWLAMTYNWLKDPSASRLQVSRVNLID